MAQIVAQNKAELEQAGWTFQSEDLPDASSTIYIRVKEMHELVFYALYCPVPVARFDSSDDESGQTATVFYGGAIAGSLIAQSEDPKELDDFTAFALSSNAFSNIFAEGMPLIQIRSFDEFIAWLKGSLGGDDPEADELINSTFEEITEEEFYATPSVMKRRVSNEKVKLPISLPDPLGLLR